ncbi:MAG: hypothetical protein ACRELD_12830 [Longimicrobiales bacterium]
MIGGTIHIRSGWWEWRAHFLEAERRGELKLVSLDEPGEEMTVDLPAAWREYAAELIQDFARAPRQRIWRDRQGSQWRVTEQLLDVATRGAAAAALPPQLEFVGGNEAWMAPRPRALRLGQLTREELQSALDRARGAPRAQTTAGDQQPL